MQEEQIICRGINGSIRLSSDRLTVIGVGFSSPQDIKFNDVASVVVERKSIVPFATLTVLAAIILAIARYNLLWFIVNVYSVQMLVIPIAPLIALAIAILCGIPTILRLVFVNVSVSSGGGKLMLRVVPIRSAKRLARRFSEISAGS